MPHTPQPTLSPTVCHCILFLQIKLLFNLISLLNCYSLCSLPSIRSGSSLNSVVSTVQLWACPSCPSKHPVSPLLTQHVSLTVPSFIHPSPGSSLPSSTDLPSQTLGALFFDNRPSFEPTSSTQHFESTHSTQLPWNTLSVLGALSVLDKGSKSPSTLSPISLIPWTWSLQTGPQANALWDIMPLRGGTCHGLPSLALISSIQDYINQSLSLVLLLVLDSTQGCLSVHSAGGIPQLDLWGSPLC